MTEHLDTLPLIDFQQDARPIIERMKQVQRPCVLTVDGSPEIVVQDARSYQALLDRIREMEDLVAIGEGLAQAEAGDSRPARELFADLKRKHRL